MALNEGVVNILSNGKRSGVIFWSLESGDVILVKNPNLGDLMKQIEELQPKDYFLHGNIQLTSDQSGVATFISKRYLQSKVKAASLEN